ncbi:MAG: hypothetical protein RBR86_05385 [Pseudobdellovibrionaceae bacterium]|nr:hypothetical protein [Pseudobdellovibrionaceae bacterium]
MRQKLSTLLFTSILSGLSIAPISHAESQESSAKGVISNWISPPDIALEPILLSSEQLYAAQIEELLQTGGGL